MLMSRKGSCGHANVHAPLRGYLLRRITCAVFRPVDAVYAPVDAVGGPADAVPAGALNSIATALGGAIISSDGLTTQVRSGATDDRRREQSVRLFSGIA